MDIERLGAATILRGGDVDAEKTRERTRQRRLLRLSVVLIAFLVWMWSRLLSGQDIGIGLPSIPQGRSDILISLGLMVCLAALILTPMIAAGRSPHVLFRPSETGVSLSDVVGAPQTTREAIDTLNLFLAHRTFTKELGGKPRRGVLFEGPPGTGKTYLAKAMAGEAGVPFLFVSASAFQSMYYGQTNRKIRTYFKALRKAARKEGGAIGFIEEFDAIGASRSSMGSSTMREGVTGIVNELLVQMQSFDMPTGGMKVVARLVDFVNLWLPTTRHLRPPRTTPANVLIIAATNRAADLDPALLRPGRFDRIIHFDLPPRTDRVAIAEYYLARKAHGDDVSADDIAGLTTGYSPVSIERLLDEALICALRHGRRQMTTKDVLQAKLVTELGLSHDAGYQPEERHRIAVHEAGHALLAELVRAARQRGVDPAPVRRARARVARRLRGAPPVHAAAGDEADPHRARRHGGGGARVRRGIERHQLRSRCRHHHCRSAGRIDGRGRLPAQPRSGKRSRCRATSSRRSWATRPLGRAAERIIDDAESAARELMIAAPRRPARDRDGAARAGRAQW